MVDLAAPGWPDLFGEQLRHLTQLHRWRPIRTLSLFSGGGGLDIGFHDAGFDIREMVEIDDHCAAVLEANTAAGRVFHGASVHAMDVRSFTPNLGEKYEFVIGGPPCQSFSAAGRRAEGVAGLNDDRGTLFEEFVRVLRVVRPRGFLFENVYGITGANGGRAWEAIRAAFTSAGYHVFHRILDAADYGVPQHRERAIIVGVQDGVFAFPRPTHGPDSPTDRPHYTAGVAVSGAGLEPDTPIGVNGRYGHLLAQVPPGLNYSFFTERMGHPRPVFAWRSKFSDFLYKADPVVPVRTVKAQGGQYTGPFHWNNRPFSVSEFKRLQTFPDGYAMPVRRQAAVKMIGNSVPPQFARLLALAVRQHVFCESLPWEVDGLTASEELGFRVRKRSRTTTYQTTATLALAHTAPATPVRRVTRSKLVRYVLSDSFALSDCDEGPFLVEMKFTKKVWSVGVGQRKALGCVTVRPRPGTEWVLPTEQVELYFDPGIEKSFVVAWKAFEQELAGGGYKADLVQLNGYYQYPSAIVAELTFNTEVPTEWRVLAEVCGGVGVAATLKTRDLAKRWQLNVADTHRVVRWLRGLGYEVRNSNTNGEMPTGSYLIPYPFPTLTPQSVQLRKQLD